jgi:hypothetical protein
LVKQAETLEKWTNYTAFGSQMPGRTYNATDYRYGMNTQEKDNEIASGIYTAEFWEYDSRIARRWNLDPIPNPSMSDYTCFSDNPILNEDQEGDSPGSTTNNENTAEVKSDPPLKTAKFTFLLGNTFSTPGQKSMGANHPTFAFPLNGGTQVYNNTNITNWAFTEPNFLGQALWRVSGGGSGSNEEIGITMQKLKTQPIATPAGLVKLEAPSGISFTFGKSVPVKSYNHNRVNFSYNVYGMLGTTWGHPQFEPGATEIPIPIHVGPWGLIGLNGSVMVRIDATITKRITIFQATTINHLRTFSIASSNGTIPSQDQTSLSFQWGAGLKMPGKNKQGKKIAD